MTFQEIINEEKNRDFGGTNSIQYEVEILQPNGPDDCEWIEDEAFDDDDAAIEHAKKLQDEGYRARVMFVQYKLGPTYRSQYWGDD